MVSSFAFGLADKVVDIPKHLFYLGLNTYLTYEFDVEIDYSIPRNILLIGETGSGKSCLVKLLLNYFNRGDFEYSQYNLSVDLFHEATGLDPIENENDRESSTRVANVYRFDKLGKTILKLIDTPGLKDTNGYDHDKVNLQSINSALKQLGKEENITAVFFLFNNEASKSKDIIDYVFESFKIFFPNQADIKLVAIRANEFRSIKTMEIPKALTIPLNNPLVLVSREKEN